MEKGTLVPVFQLDSHGIDKMFLTKPRYSKVLKTILFDQICRDTKSWKKMLFLFGGWEVGVKLIQNDPISKEDNF